MGRSLKKRLISGSGVPGALYTRYQTKKDNESADAAARAASATESPGDKLIRLQTEQILEEQELYQAGRPEMLRISGLMETDEIDPVTGNKKVRAMTQDEKIASMTSEEKSAYDTEQIIAERSAKAARGELDTPSYVTDELDRQRKTQSSLLSQRLGAKGANLSTGGINTKVNQFGNEESVKSAYSYGNESTGMGLLGQYNNYLGNQQGQNLNTYGGFSNAGLNILPMAQTASQPYTFGRQLNDERQGIMDARKQAALNGTMSAVGTVASMYLSKGSGGSS